LRNIFFITYYFRHPR